MAVLTSAGVTFGDATQQASARVGPGYQAFTSSGTFTVPAGITALRVRVFGGAGSGLAGSSTSGACGGYVEAYLTGMTPGASITVTVGAGGASTTSGVTGNTGGTSSFGAFATATGASASTNALGIGRWGTGSTTGTIISRTQNADTIQGARPSMPDPVTIGAAAAGNATSYGCSSNGGGGGGMSGGGSGTSSSLVSGGYAYGAGSNGANSPTTGTPIGGAGGAGGVQVFW